MDDAKLPEMTLADLTGKEGEPLTPNEEAMNNVLVDIGRDPMRNRNRPSCAWPRQEVPRSELKGLRWHVVHCANPSDDDISQALKNADYPEYYPHTIEMRPVPKRSLPPKERNNPIRKLKRTKVPIFPRYRFVRFDVRDGRWHELFELIGIQGVLCHEECARPQPAPVMDEAVAALMGLEVDGLIPGKVTVKNLAYAIGEQVRISNGAFVGFNGFVQDVPEKALDELDGSERLTVLVNLFGRHTPVELEIGDIEKL
jgi:transcription termination/antitermination protein NusG